MVERFVQVSRAGERVPDHVVGAQQGAGRERHRRDQDL
jgi:hypothetical protein